MVKNMKNKDKYDLRNITYAAVKSNNGEFDFAIYHNSIEIYRENFNNSNSRCAFTKWLEEEYVPDILTDKEKAYLSAVIKPFRERRYSLKKCVV